MDASNLWDLAITEYFILFVMRFHVVAGDGAVCYQCSNPRLRHSSPGVPVPLLARLPIHVHDYSFWYLISGSALQIMLLLM